MDIPHFTHLSFDGHLGFWPLWIIVLWTSVQFLCERVFFSVGWIHIPGTQIAGSCDNSAWDWFFSAWEFLFSCFLACLVIMKIPDVVTFTLLGARYFCNPRNTLELCSWMQFIYQATVWSFQVLRLQRVGQDWSGAHNRCHESQDF